MNPDDGLIEAIQRRLGRLLNEWSMADDDGMEWHECDTCPNMPDNPCPCSGQPWAKPELARAAYAAMVEHLGLTKERTEWGVQRGEPYKGVIHATSEAEARRISERFGWVVVSRRRLVSEWKPQP